MPSSIREACSPVSCTPTLELLSRLFESSAPLTWRSPPLDMVFRWSRVRVSRKTTSSRCHSFVRLIVGADSGVIGFRAWVRAFLRAPVPIVFLPGGLHLRTIPGHRKVNSVDIGTADKVCVAALALLVQLAGIA